MFELKSIEGLEKGHETSRSNNSNIISRSHQIALVLQDLPKFMPAKACHCFDAKHQDCYIARNSESFSNEG